MINRMTDLSQDSGGRLTRAMRLVLWSVGAIVILVLGAALWLTAMNTDEDAAIATPTAAPTSDDSTPDAAPSSAGPLPGATPTIGSEVLETTTGPPESPRLPDLPVTSPLVTAPLPTSSSADGGLVEDFPVEIIGPSPESEILSSSIATEGKAMQTTLVARTDNSAETVTAHYRALWAELGLVGQDGPGPEGIAFTGRQASLTLAFSGNSATGTVYTILASFRTE